MADMIDDEELNVSEEKPNEDNIESAMKPRDYSLRRVLL